MHTCYMIDGGTFNSDDRGSNPGYKVDMNIHTARYMLQTWQRLKMKEGVDRKDWYEAAVRALDWALKQQNPDGGLPQKLDYSTMTRSISVCSGRAMVGLPIIARINRRREVHAGCRERRTVFTEERRGSLLVHRPTPGLPPSDAEADSIWCLCEYWLDKYERTKDPECLARAKANGYFGFLMLCPKQLSWVKNPTQTCHTEQLNCLQYSNYAYHNRKLDCLYRLGKLTGESVFSQLFKRIVQCGFWTQVTEATIAAHNTSAWRPWKKTSGKFDSKGSLYLNELSLDANLQLLEMGIAKPVRSHSIL